MHPCPYCEATFWTAQAYGHHRRIEHLGTPTRRDLERGPKRTDVQADVNANAREWTGRAACAGAPTAWFFPERAVHPKEALDLCARCEVVAECLDYCLAHEEEGGVWGGTTPRQRRGMRSSRGVA